MCLRELVRQGRIQAVNLGGGILVIFARQVSYRLCYCKREMKYKQGSHTIFKTKFHDIP